MTELVNSDQFGEGNLVMSCGLCKAWHTHAVYSGVRVP